MNVLAALCAGLALALLLGGPGPAGTWRRIGIDPDRLTRLRPAGPPVRPGDGTVSSAYRPAPSPGYAPRGSAGPARPGWGGRPTRPWGRARLARRTSGEVTEACLAMVAELRTGTSPREALGVVARTHPDLLGRPAAQVGLGGDAPPALREAARVPGAGALRAVAAAWEVSERSGARLADVLTAVADGLRADEAVLREAGTQLASVRATTRLLAVLPVLTLLVMSGGGGRPTAFLLGTAVGWACLLAGAGLTVAGLVWIERMAAAATRSPWSEE